MLHQTTALATLVTLFSLAASGAMAEDATRRVPTPEPKSQVQIDLDAEVAEAKNVDLAATDLSTRELASIVQTARKCERFDRREDATDLYQRSAVVCEALLTRDAKIMTAEQAAAVLATAAKSLTGDGRHAEAAKWLKLAIEQEPGGAFATRIGQSLLSVASGFLDQADLEQSQQSYQLAVDVLIQAAPQDLDSLATARLGLAWTMVMKSSGAHAEGNLDAEATHAALQATNIFLENHAGHADASSALMLKLSCETQLQEAEAASRTQSQILAEYPRSVAACEVLKSVCRWQSELTDVEEPIRQYLIVNYAFVIKSPAISSNLDVLSTGLLAAAVQGHAEAETAYSVALSITDEIGDASTYVLEHLHTAGHDAAASRIAIGWVSARDAEGRYAEIAQMQKRSGHLITVGAREAACRWAGRTGHWSVLAMAAEEETGLFHSQESEAAAEEARNRGRSIHVERLFAEALLQTGKTKQSLKLWGHIVDHRGASDFPTLLRTAEAAVAAGAVSQATMRVAAAQAAARSSETRGDVSKRTDGSSSDSSRLALTDLLSANLEIRQLRFDRGRAYLEQVVRSAEADTSLRGRAQWMIGETYFMQQKFSDAIAAYRQVEPIGKSDEWTAAALVQAGKSFEQLGRTREATVCYSTLVSRFGESPHAGGARRRLAAMTGTDPESQTMRR